MQIIYVVDVSNLSFALNALVRGLHLTFIELFFEIHIFVNVSVWESVYCEGKLVSGITDICLIPQSEMFDHSRFWKKYI